MRNGFRGLCVGLGLSFAVVQSWGAETEGAEPPTLPVPELFTQAQQPATTPAPGQPATGQPATGQPATGQPATGQPATGQPATGQPATGQPATGQSGTGQQGTGQQGEGQQGTGQGDAGQTNTTNTNQQTPDTSAGQDVATPSSAPSNTPFEMIGDMIPFPKLFQIPAPVVSSSSSSSSSGTSHGVLLPLASNYFKVADNQSPRPMDRVFFSSNSYDGFYNNINRSLGSGIGNMHIYQQTFGIEKTFLDGEASISLSAPINTFNANTSLPGLNANSTSGGDLSIVIKTVLLRSDDWNRLISGGLALTVPTGPNSFAGNGFSTYHNTVFQPFVAFLVNTETFYVQGFSQIAVPTDGNNVTLWFNDIGVGYWLYQDCDGSFLTKVAPTIEAHVNTPMNHQGLNLNNPSDPLGVPNNVNLTGAMNFEFANRARLAIGGAIPVTGPTPFNGELIAQFRVLY